MTTNGGKKEHIKVFVLTGPETSGIVAHEVKNSQGDIEHRGFAIDLFNKAIQQPHMKNKYTFDIEFMKDTGKINYDKIVQQVGDGTYDIAIGGFVNTAGREKIVDFTVPTKIDSTALYYVPQESNFNIKIQTIKEIAQLVSVAIILGILMGILVFYFNPKRKQMHTGISKKGFFYRTIITTVSSMFGEMGYLSENTTPNMKGLLIAVFVMILAFLFLIFIQAKLTTSMIETKINRDLSEYTVNRGIVLGHEGYALARRFEEMGGHVKYIKNADNNQLIDMYLKNQDKYIGVAISYCDGYPFLQLNPELNASLGHGNHATGFPVNNNKDQFLTDLNSAIMNMISDKSLRTLCESYFGTIESEKAPTCTLT